MTPNPKPSIRDRFHAMSYVFGQMAFAEAYPAIPDLDPRMTATLRKAEADHRELMAHVSSWSNGWHMARKIRRDIQVSERIPALNSLPAKATRADRQYRFPRA